MNPRIAMMVWGCVSSFWALNVWGQASPLKMLTQTPTAFEQTIPFVVISPGDQKAKCLHLRLGWKPWGGTSPVMDQPLVFDLDPKTEPQAGGLLRSQLWISALASALAWQQPWVSAHWNLSEVTLVEIPAMGAALSVGLISTASNVPFPQTTAILGILYPDGSIGPVSQLIKRMEAAETAGMKCVVVSSLQRFAVTSSGNFVNIQALAQAHGLECLFVDDLAQAAEKVLHQGMPFPPGIHALPHYAGELLNVLDKQCQKEMSPLQTASLNWPRKPAELTTLSLPQQKLWKEVFQNYDAGLDAYRAGLLYVTRERLNTANAKLRAISAWTSHPENPDYKANNARAMVLRQKIVSHMNLPSMDKNELQSALVLAEEDHWLNGINARVEGAQMLVRQALGPRTDASVQQKEQAQNLLFTVVNEAEYQLQDLEYYPSLHHSIHHPESRTIPGQASQWLFQMTPAYLSEAEFLDQGLKLHASEYGQTLLFDPRLATHIRVLADERTAWERQEQAAHTVWEQKMDSQRRQEMNAHPPLIKVGFIPGSAYAPPVPLVLPPKPKSLSDTVQTLIWANRYCEVAALEQKYLGIGGVFDPLSTEWKKQNHALLKSMLRSAELGARRGIALAEKAEVDPAILILIYEHASHLGSSEEEEDGLEALQHYWRCGLLGSLCWQLGGNLKTVVPISVTAPVIPSTTGVKASPTPTPLPPPVMPSPHGSPVTLPPSLLPSPDERPPSVPAIPVPLEEQDKEPPAELP